jgi:hypothetical protein
MNGPFKIGVFLFTSPFRIYSSNLKEDPNGKYIKLKIAQRKNNNNNRVGVCTNKLVVWIGNKS